MGRCEYWVPAPQMRRIINGQRVPGFCEVSGDQWSIGDWHSPRRARQVAVQMRVRPCAARRAAPRRSRPESQRIRSRMGAGAGLHRGDGGAELPTSGCWPRSRCRCSSRTTAARDPATGVLIGAISDSQAGKVKELITSAGRSFEYVSLPDTAHAMHQADPARFAQVLTAWAKKLPA